MLIITKSIHANFPIELYFCLQLVSYTRPELNYERPSNCRDITPFETRISAKNSGKDIS